MTESKRGGWIRTDRDLLNHPSMLNERTGVRDNDKVVAWLWILNNAAWKDHVATVRGKPIELKRGEALGARRHLAKEWLCGLSKVDRILKRFVEHQMISHRNTNDGGVSIISVLNYSSFQGGSEKEAPHWNAARRPDDVSLSSHRDYSNKETNKQIEDSPLDARALEGDPSEEIFPTTDEQAPLPDHVESITHHSQCFGNLEPPSDATIRPDGMIEVTGSLRNELLEFVSSCYPGRDVGELLEDFLFQACKYTPNDRQKTKSVRARIGISQLKNIWTENSERRSKQNGQTNWRDERRQRESKTLERARQRAAEYEARKKRRN